MIFINYILLSFCRLFYVVFILNFENLDDPDDRLVPSFNLDGDLSDKFIIRFNGKILGIIKKTSKFFVAFRIERATPDTTYTMPLCFTRLEDQSQNHWSQSTPPSKFFSHSFFSFLRICCNHIVVL